MKLKSEILHLGKVVWDYHHMHHELQKSDIIIVLGSQDTRVADRGIELFKESFADTILFSGGVGRVTSHDHNFAGTTEADKFAAKAIQQGVPVDKIIIENKSTNTGENIRFSFDLIKNMNITRLILVQKPYMERRTFATFAQQWPGDNPVFYVTSPQISFEEYPNEEISIESVINMMVGDLQRIIEYPKRGLQIPQVVPADVLQAYEKLIELGFTKHLI